MECCCCFQLLLFRRPSLVVNNNLRQNQQKQKKKWNQQQQQQQSPPIHKLNFPLSSSSSLVKSSSSMDNNNQSTAGITTTDTTEEWAMQETKGSGSTSSVEDISVISVVTDAKEIKIRIDVSGARTQAIFDKVFSKMVDAAQPIPGFQRVKGGKTPNVPKDVLLHILGPSKVYNKVIKKVINTAIAEYVEKENLKVAKDLRVDQSYEELEDDFEPGDDFSFDAVIHLQD